MRRLCQVPGAALVLCAFALPAGALVHSIFEGLDLLIDRSEHVVVAMVVSPPPGLSTVPSTQVQKVQVTRVLKGAIQTGSVVEVRLAPSMIGPILTGAAVAEFVPTQYYVLFLNGSGPPYAQTLTPGSAFWIAPTGLPGERPADTRAAVAVYLESTRSYLEARRATVDARIREYLGAGHP